MKAFYLPVCLLALASLPLHAEQENMRAKLGEVLKEDGKKAAEAPRAAGTDGAKAQSAQTSAQAKAAEKAKADKVVDLPQLKVEGRKVPKETETTFEAKKTVVLYDKKIERESKHTTPTNLDTKLNPDTYSYLGNRSAAISAEESKQRVHEMEVKQSIAAVATDPTNDEENKKLLEMLKDLEYRKNKDAVPDRK